MPRYYALYRTTANDLLDTWENRALVCAEYLTRSEAEKQLMNEIDYSYRNGANTHEVTKAVAMAVIPTLEYGEAISLGGWEHTLWKEEDRD